MTRSQLEELTGLPEADLREAVKPLFVLMYRHGLRRVDISKDGVCADVEVTTDSGECVSPAANPETRSTIKTGLN